jgi:protoporphyrinogen oxidase
LSGARSARAPEAAPTGTRVAIIGAGPAGLTAALLLAKAGIDALVLEADPEYVGGISRTVQHEGFRFDIGGHRFFSKSAEVEDLWTEILPELRDRPRSSRIYYGGKLYSYPLRAGEALAKLGVVEAARCVLSYAKSRAFPVREPANFEEWVTNQFGNRLFSIFFKTYTEKVWGMPCREISADWAVQRIKGLSLGTAVRNALFPQNLKDRRRVVKTLIDTFRYPPRGPGMLWESCAEQARTAGARILMGHRATRLLRRENGRWTVTAAGPDGAEVRVEAEQVVSSAPLREIALALDPPLSGSARAAAQGLRYRDFLTVMLILEDRDRFDDNWIYVHDPGVRVGRVQNFKSWSPDMIPDASLCSYGLEYFCFEGDELWSAADADLIELAKRELDRIGIACASEVRDGCVVRQPKAYPVYDHGYAERVDVLRRELAEFFPTLHLVGRNGMHKYNNQDHAMMTAMLTVKNIVAGRQVYDVWQVNQDAEYHEAPSVGGRRA